MWASKHSVFHWNGWFKDDKFAKWDPENNYKTKMRDTIIDRGVEQLQYNPKIETSFIRKYKIVIDVWNFNKFWQYSCFI